MTGRPIDLGELQTDAAGEPWAFPTPGGGVLYFPRAILAKIAGKLAGGFAPVDAPGARAERVHHAVTATLDGLWLRTLCGTLTALGRPPSVDHVCTGPGVRELWAAELVTVVGRPLAVSSCTGLTSGADGRLLVLVTITPRSRRWHRILQGEPLPPDLRTHRLGPGDRFRQDDDTDYRRS